MSDMLDELRAERDTALARAEKAEAEQDIDRRNRSEAIHALTEMAGRHKRRADIAEAQLASINKTLRACRGEDLGALLARATTAEAEVSRLTSLIDEAAEALLDATANLAGAASAYRKYACRSRTVGRGVADPFFTTRASDFDAAVERARALLPRLKEPSRAE